jgi:hypothetical protein
VQQAAKSWEAKEWEAMGLAHSSTLNFICAAGDSVTIHVLRKKMSFYFNYPRILDAGSRSQKVWKFKRF